MADRIINSILIGIGIGIFAALWWNGWLPLDVIWRIISGEV